MLPEQPVYRALASGARCRFRIVKPSRRTRPRPILRNLGFASHDWFGRGARPRKAHELRVHCVVDCGTTSPRAALVLGKQTLPSHTAMRLLLHSRTQETHRGFQRSRAATNQRTTGTELRVCCPRKESLEQPRGRCTELQSCAPLVDEPT